MTSWVPGAGADLEGALALRNDLLPGWRALVAVAGPVPELAAGVAEALGDDPHAVGDADVAALVESLGPAGVVRALVAAALADSADRLAAILEVDR